MKNIIFLLLGAAGGSAITYFVMDSKLKTKYEELYEKDIQSSKEFYEHKVAELNERLKDIAEKNVAEKGSNVIEYAKEHETYIPEEDEEDDDSDYYEEVYNDIAETYSGRSAEEPYVISPDEYGENHDYEQIELVYYSDGVLADDENDRIRNPEELIGENTLDSFGEYEDDAVYVRNEKFRCEYAILRDYRPYSEILAMMPDNRRIRNMD